MLVSRSELDAVEDPSERLLLALRGVFAGNIFDLGAAASSQLFDNEGVSSCNSRQPSYQYQCAEKPGLRTPSFPSIVCNFSNL